MEQPGRLHTLFKTLPGASDSSSVASITGHRSVDEVIRTLGGPDLATLLRYVRGWNANAKTSTVAQRVLHAVVRLRRADEIAQAFDQTAALGGLGDALASVADGAAAVPREGRGASALRELVEALVPYTERHLARMERLVQESYVVDYLLGEMDDGLIGLDDDADDDGEEMTDERHGEQDGDEEWAGMDIDVNGNVAVAA